MRKILTITLAVFATTIFAGCLKDKDFEDQKYGIQIKEIKGVAFPQASQSPVVVGINSQTTSQEVAGPLLTLEAEAAPTSPVTVTLQINPTLVTNAGLISLAPTDFTVNSLTVTFAPGQTTSDAVKITLPNTSGLDPTESYGIGFTITTADQGYKIAANQKDVIIAFNIKNKYDGRYNLRGYHNRTSPDYSAPYNVTVYMITSGPYSVSMWYPAPGPGDYAHPIAGSTGGYYGDFGTNFTFDPATEKIVSWDFSPYATSLPTSMGPATDSRYEPASGGNPAMIYANFYYSNNPGARAFFDTLTYLGPRP